MIHKTKEYREAQAKRVAELWAKPEYRAKMMKAQNKIGYRQYPVKVG